MPLVLHGGTGIPEDMIKKAISLGVAKINVNTECQLAFADATRKYIEAGKDLEGKGFDPRKLSLRASTQLKRPLRQKWSYSVLSAKLTDPFSLHYHAVKEMFSLAAGRTFFKPVFSY